MVLMARITPNYSPDFHTWLIAKSNEFFENVGMSEAKKPISKIIMFPKGEK